MNIINFFKKNKNITKTWSEQTREALMQEDSSIEALLNGYEYSVNDKIWDGEKSQGELGAPINYVPDYTNLAYRSWKAFTESDIAQIIVNARVDWVIGQGLTLSAEPATDVINKEGYNFNTPEFVKETEQRYKLYTNTRYSVYSQMHDFNKAQRLAERSACVGGDVLIIFRVGEQGPNVQLIDGRAVQDPTDASMVAEAEERGNKIIHGVEIDGETGEHVAFYINKEDYTSVRILAYGELTGRLQACLKYGSEYRVDDVRGLPLLSAMLEKITKIDRYVEASISGVEERAKVIWTWKHDNTSDGTNPDIAAIAHAASGGVVPDTDTVAATNKELADTGLLIARSTGKTVYNLPIGVSLEALESRLELNMAPFVNENFIYISAAARVPYEVALMKYVNSFSSSRMATQSWLHILQIERNISTQYLQKPFYNLYLDIRILEGKIQADGYRNAILKNDVELIQAYRECRFTGTGVPQADQKKETENSIMKIQNNLSTIEKETEILNGGNFESNIKKRAAEMKLIEKEMPEQKPDQE